MEHQHLCYDCQRVIVRACRSSYCIFEADVDAVYEQCPRCVRRASRADEQARYLDCGPGAWDDRDGGE